MAAAEQKKSYQVVKQFKGLDTKANRTAIDETEFSWIENVQPIGYANLKVVPNSIQVFDGSNNAVTFAGTNYFNSINLNITDYVVSFNSNGSAEYYQVQTNTKGTIAPAGKFSNSGISVCQWNNQYMMILDPEKGLFSWDGTNVVTVGSIGVVAITNPGTGYTLPPLVTISAPNDTNGIQANAVTTLVQGGNSVGGIFTLTGGSGYTSAPTVTLTSVDGSGSGATAIAGILTFANSTVTVNVVDGGAGYSSTPLITIAGGGGTGAVGNAVVSGNTVTQVIMTNPGSGYSNQANLTVSITGGGASKNAVVTATINNTPNIAVQTFSGRVWVAQGRTVFFSAAGSFSEFTSVSAGSVTLVDSTLHGNIQQLLSANNFLYIFGDDSINVFSDVRVQSNGTTLFTNTNVSASVGSRRAEAIFPYFRSVLFMNDYGIYALVGSTTSKLSDPLDGVFPNIDFASPIYAGQVLINNILCAAFNFKYYDSQFTGTYRYIQAVYFEKKWFITSQDDNLAYITSVPVAGKIALFGTSSNKLYKLYSTGASNNITSRVQTALMPMGDPIRTKQALKVAIEATNYNAPINLTATVDSESISESLNSLSSLIYWTNIYGTTISWLNNSNSVIGWDASGYQLFKSDASNYGKYLGCTVTSNSGGFIYNGFEFEHELRVRF